MDNGTKLLISRGIYRFETYTKGQINRKHDNCLFILKSCIHHKLLFSFNTLDILENTPSSSPSSQEAFNTEQNRSCSHSIVISCISRLELRQQVLDLLVLLLVLGLGRLSDRRRARGGSVGHLGRKL